MSPAHPQPRQRQVRSAIVLLGAARPCSLIMLTFGERKEVALLETLCVVVLMAFAAVGAFAVAVLTWTATAPGTVARWAPVLSAALALQSLAAWAQTLCIAAGFMLVASLLTRGRHS